MHLIMKIAALLSGERRRRRRQLEATFKKGFEQAHRASRLNVYKPGSNASVPHAGARL
jgi:hypothetical protein